jgi:hypothetical protein
MKAIRCCLTALFLALLLASEVASAQQPVTNDALVKMSKAGLTDDVILAVVASQSGRYTTTPEALIELKQAGVSSRVIGSILTRMGTTASAPPPAAAQPMAAQPAVSKPEATPRTRSSALPSGTPVRLRLLGGISSANAEVGQPVDLELVDTVYRGGSPLVSSGARASGVVTLVEHRGFMGRGGKLGIAIRWLELPNGEQAPLRSSKLPVADGHFDDISQDTVIEARNSWLAAPLFLLKGSDVSVPDGSVTTAYFDRVPRTDSK